MNWDTISGHAEVVRVLRNLVAANRIPHAMLFTGPAGVGKMMTARILAAALLCQGKGEVLPCGHCQACKKVLDQSHPDLMVVAGEKGSIKIDQVRTLQQQAAMVPYYGGRRIFILEDIETMTAQAANSLLKILEEPPESATFIMTTVSTHALLPTVLSRCRVFSFRALGFEVLTDYLVKRGIDLIAAKAAARLAGGSIGNALALTASPGGLSLRDQAVTLITQVPDGDLSLVWQTAGEMDKRETGELGHLFHYMSIIFRDLVMGPFWPMPIHG
ncbi:MAG: dnaX 1 [Firmicutes bacterium]|nr:dnaX 1 [Bacillota bacterium]